MGKVKYKVVARINPQDKEEEKRYYPCAKSMGELTLEDMCKLIEKNCTLTSTDIMAVLNATDEVMREQLANSMIVRVGNLGHMRLSLSGKGALTPEKFTVGHITKARIIFTPSKATKKALKVLEYERYVPEKEEPTNAEGDSDEGVEGETQE